MSYYIRYIFYFNFFFLILFYIDFFSRYFYFDKWALVLLIHSGAEFEIKFINYLSPIKINFFFPLYLKLCKISQNFRFENKKKKIF